MTMAGAPAEAPRPVLVRLSPLLTTLFPAAEARVALRAATVRELVDALDER